MKATGITRKVDPLGRIVIPKELRNVLGIDIKDPLEIFTEGDNIILTKYTPDNACIITGEVTDKNIMLINGEFPISPKGAELLLKELTNIFSSTK